MRSACMAAWLRYVSWGLSARKGVGRPAYFSKPINSNQRPAALRYSQGWVESRVAGGSVYMVCDGMGKESSASPADPCMAVVFCEIEHGGFAGEECQVDTGLLRGRRMAAEYGVVLRAPGLIQDLARGDTVAAASSDTPAMKSFLLTCAEGFGFGASGRGFVLRVAGNCEEQ